MKEDVKIAGAGIAGLTSAIILAKNKYRVKVLERNKDVGLRFNGDFQGIMNWGFDQDAISFLKEMDIIDDLWYHPMKKLDCFDPRGESRTVKTHKPYAYLIKRGNSRECLDHSLRNKAEKTGVNITYRQPVTKDEVDIVATGPVFGGITDAMAIGYTFKTDHKDTFAIVFDNSIAPGGYAYLLIAKGHGTLASCIFKDFTHLSDYLNIATDFFRSRYTLKLNNSQKFSGTGSFFLPVSNIDPETRKKYAGEAGGFQDYLFGFGIRYAMLTGYLAAHSIMENKNYDKLWKKNIKPMLKTSVSNRLWFSITGQPGKKSLTKILSAHKDPIKLFTDLYKPNIFSKIGYPVARLYYSKHLYDKRKT